MSIEPERVNYDAYSFRARKGESVRVAVKREKKGIMVDSSDSAKKIDAERDEKMEHEIVDERRNKKDKRHARIKENAKSNDRKKTKKQGIYEKKNNKTSGAFRFVVMLFVITITLLICICIVGYKQLEAQSVYLQSGSKTYYAVELYRSPDFESSHVFADALRKQGGGGFVKKAGESYVVLAACYERVDDAKKVVDKLMVDGNDAKIFNMVIPFYPEKDYGLDNNIYFDKCIIYADMVYRNLFEISNSLDLEKIGETNAMNKIKMVTERVKTTRKKLELFEQKKVDYRVAKLKIEMDIAIAMLENLSNPELTRPNLLCDIRYTYLFVLNNYIAMINSFCA